MFFHQRFLHRKLCRFLITICIMAIMACLKLTPQPELAVETFLNTVERRHINNNTNTRPNGVLDAVISYVDGSDMQFLSDLQRERSNDTVELPFAASKNRFADNSDLLYLLRSLDQFGSIFRNVLLLVAYESQIPTWLNLNNPRLKIVYHRDIWYNRTQLPVFNSYAVEANLHHIRNLSNVFVYFNDDFSLTNPLSISDFVRKKSIVIRPDFNRKTPKKYFNSKSSDAHYVNSLVATSAVLRKSCNVTNIGRYKGANNFLQHSPYVLDRSVLYKAESNPHIFPFFEHTWATKFRSGTELNTMAFFNTYAQCANLSSVVFGSSSESVYVSYEQRNLNPTQTSRLSKSLEEISRKIQAGKVKFLCVNDNTVENSRVAERWSAATLVQNWRNKLFRRKSSFER